MVLIDTPAVAPFDATPFVTYTSDEDISPTEAELVEDLPDREPTPQELAAAEKPLRRGKGYLRAEAAPEDPPTASSAVDSDSDTDEFGAGIDESKDEPSAANEANSQHVVTDPSSPVDASETATAENQVARAETAARDAGARDAGARDAAASDAAASDAADTSAAPDQRAANESDDGPRKRRRRPRRRRGKESPGAGAAGGSSTDTDAPKETKVVRREISKPSEGDADQAGSGEGRKRRRRRGRRRRGKGGPPSGGGAGE